MFWGLVTSQRRKCSGKGGYPTMREQREAILGCVEYAGGWNRGWKEKRLEKEVEGSLRWLCVPTGDCVGALAASSGAALGAGSPLWSRTDSLRRMAPSGTPFAVILGLAETFHWRLNNITLDSRCWVSAYISGPGSYLCSRCAVEGPRLQRQPGCCWRPSPLPRAACSGTRLQSYICDSFARVMWRLCPLVRSLDFLNWASCYFN